MHTRRLTLTQRKQLQEDFLFIRFLLESSNLGRVLRWRKGNQSAFRTPQEVAEMNEDLLQHNSMMMLLLTAFVKKAAFEGDTKTAELDVGNMTVMIIGHDADEIILGDTRVKDTAYCAMEKRAQEKVFVMLRRLNFGKEVVGLLHEYHAKKTPEARFVKAIDEVQAWLYLIYVGQIGESSRNFLNPTECSGYTCAQEFPVLKRLTDILLRIMQRPAHIRSCVSEMVRLEL